MSKATSNRIMRRRVKYALLTIMIVLAVVLGLLTALYQRSMINAPNINNTTGLGINNVWYNATQLNVNESINNILTISHVYSVNNGSDGLIIKYSFVVVNDELYLFIDMVNTGNTAINISLSSTLPTLTNGSLLTPCFSKPVKVYLAQGYYGPSQLNHAEKHSLQLITYLPIPAFCPIMPSKIYEVLSPGGKLSYYLPITGLISNSSIPIVPISPGNYTFVITDAFNQTVIINLSFRIYVGSIMYVKNNTIFLVMPIEPRAIKIVSNGSSTTYYPTTYLGPFNGIIAIKGVNPVYVRELEVLINGNWYTLIMNKTAPTLIPGAFLNLYGMGIWWVSSITGNLPYSVVYSVGAEPMES